MTSSIWLLSLSIMFSRFCKVVASYIAVCMNLSFLQLNYFIVYIQHLLKDVWVLHIFWLLWILLPWTFIYNSLRTSFHFFWINVRNGIAGSYGNLMFTFWGLAKLFSTVTEPFYIPTSNIWGFQFQFIVTNTCSYPVKKNQCYCYPFECRVPKNSMER